MRYILPWKARIAILLLLLFAGTSGAQVLSTAGSSAPSISYQAQITGKDGKPISGEHTVTITIYTDANGTQSIWTSTTKSSIGNSGILNASLGTTDNPLPTPSAMDRPLWVGLAVDGTPELRPLSTFASAPVALNVVDNAITTAKLTSNAVTADKIGTDYVGSISVNGERVTNKGSDLNIVTGSGVRSTFVPSSNTLVLSGGGSSIDGVVMAADWNEAGNAPAAGSFLGTTTSSNLTIKVNTDRVMEYSPDGTCPNILGGSSANSIGSVSGAVVAGGGKSGQPNRVLSSFGVVGGGSYNTAGVAPDDQYCTVAGGLLNWAREEYSFIGGGSDNNAESTYGMIAGGRSNKIEHEDTWAAEYSTIAGGRDNFIHDKYGSIGGGDSNVIFHNADYSNISGGQFNVISNSSDDTLNDLWHNTIGGGFTNVITGAGTNSSTIGGGSTNYAGKALITIAGGGDNLALGLASTISGGSTNTAEADYSTISGGLGNGTVPAATYGYSGAGYSNSVQDPSAATVGGAWLTTSGEGQTVLGWLNLQFGNGHLMASGQNDDRILEIGSPKKFGPSWIPSNAFEISYNGHSIVYHTNGSSIPGAGTPSVYQGATYVESPVYAWGQIDAAGLPIGLTANFGIKSVSTVGCPPGVYIIELNPVDPHSPTGPPLDISEASVTVTVINNDVHDIVWNPLAPAATESGADAVVSGRVISDSLVRAIFGDSNADSVASSSSAEEPTTPPSNPKTPIDRTAVVCGYATASQFGALGAGSEHMFVVRTYGAGQDCRLEPRPFYFKVCHR